jgi:cytochrome c-type biogenesis protein CcmH/NrfF
VQIIEAVDVGSMMRCDVCTQNSLSERFSWLTDEVLAKIREGW